MHVQDDGRDMHVLSEHLWNAPKDDKNERRSGKKDAEMRHERMLYSCSIFTEAIPVIERPTNSR